ncbi:hypothetical protein RRG08_056457 [Elysia crispata]|uniref:Uncharacterized protein n=1 Tax=Elysia crispata TaxID=231223 RepID=A0AAE0ZDS0_9GAST|nr:hypothetical protein RRG08_056457 [Elysia crispata]
MLMKVTKTWTTLMSLDTNEQNSNTVVNEPVTTDLAEAIVPPLQHPDKPTKTATTKPDPPPASFCICTDNPCHLKFSPEDIEQCRLQYLALTTEQRDNALLAKIEVGIHMESQTQKSKYSPGFQDRLSAPGHQCLSEVFPLSALCRR